MTERFRAGRHAARLGAVTAGLACAVGMAGVHPAGAGEFGPAIAVTPTTNLTDGQPVQVSGGGWQSNETVSLAVCDGRLRDITDCDPDTVSGPAVDSSGRLVGSINVRRFINTGDGRFDCLPSKCVVAAINMDSFGDPHIQTWNGISFKAPK